MPSVVAQFRAALPAEVAALLGNTAHIGRSRYGVFKPLACASACWVLCLAACSGGPSGTPTEAPPAAAAAAGSTTPLAVSPKPSPAASPSSAALPAPTPGGLPPTLVGVASAPSPAVSASSSPALALSSPGTAPSPGAAASTAATPAPAVLVAITTNLTFDPVQVVVSVGDTVAWVNQGRAPQTVTADPTRVSDPGHALVPADAQPFDSGVINAGQTFSHRFDAPGKYRYTSLPHEQQGMIGHITVRG